jgi:hypothetical protein
VGAIGLILGLLILQPSGGLEKARMRVILANTQFGRH